ncbi:MAG: phage minor head protein [Methylobacter sp.]
MPLNLSPTQIAFNAIGDGTFNKPFKEQVDFLRQKIGLPTEHHDDVIKSGHDRAFVVAGVTKADLLDDFLKAIDKVAAEGKSIGWFRKNFDSFVEKHGWAYNGARDWRTRVIYTTNIRASYAAGRYAQLNDPNLLSVRPYWKYLHNDSVMHPRPLHQSWSGMVLRHDDPFWSTHFPPNGWGCRCYIQAVRASEYKGHPAPDDGTYTKTDRYGVTHVLPKGVDYGWDYAPGANKATPFKDIIDQKLIRFPASIGADMMAALRPVVQGEIMSSYRAWLAVLASDSAAKSQVAVVGAIDPTDVTWLKSQKSIEPMTAEIAIKSGVIVGPKAVRHEKAGDAIPMSFWENLPEAITDPLAVLFDNASGKMIYIFAEDGSRRPQIAVEFDFQTGRTKTVANMIVSGYRPQIADINARIKNGSLSIMRGEL